MYSSHANTAQGDYDAIAYQAFSITRDANPPTTRHRDWSPSDDLRAIEAELRHAHQLITQDASRPWLWHFKAITVDRVGQGNIELPSLEGYRFQRKCTASPVPTCTNPAQANKLVR